MVGDVTEVKRVRRVGVAVLGCGFGAAESRDFDSHLASNKAAFAVILAFIKLGC